ncbi:MAG TPA: 6-pyruvoyl-tetrahydropterin synthase-related protein [Terracidiphilus sp.]|nr:6-pyruvoyl-tetrahydropterin synthase-related protein [Terracidiphilus sp.]
MTENAADDQGSLAGTRSSRKAFGGLAIVLLAALVAIVPLLVRGPSCGHDFNYHFFSWLDMQRNWRQGIPYPSWAPSPDYRAGEPRFIFYPPLEAMAGAALGTVLPWKLTPIALTFLILACAGLAVRALAREVMEDAPAALAGCAAIFFGYALFTAYERTDFAELTGGIWIPLLMLFVLRDHNASARGWRRALDGSAAPLALALALAWISDAPLGVMAMYLLAGMSLVVALTARSWAPIIRAAVGAVLGAGMAAIYILPAAWEERSVAIDRSTGDMGVMIQGSWLFARHSDPELALHDLVLHQVSEIVVAMVAVTLAGVLVCWLRGRLPGGRRWWLPLALLPVLVLFLQFPISLPVWNGLPELRYMQFPWRWLLVLEAPMGIFFAAAVWPARRRWILAVVPLCAALFAVETVWAARYWFQPCRPEDTVAAMVNRYRTGTVLDDSDEFAPPDSDDDLLVLGLPDACLVRDPAMALGKATADGTLVWNAAQGSCEATYSAQTSAASSVEHLLLRAEIPHPGFLILRLRTYPAWRVRVNGKSVSNLPQRDDGLFAVPVPSGSVTLTVNWKNTPDVIAARCISLIAVLLVTALCALERKLTRTRLSLVRCLPT